MDGEKHEILEQLAYIASQKRALKLITNFRGVSIHLAAGIIRCSRSSGRVRLRAHHRQMISLKAADKILVQSDLFPSMLVGDIVDVDLHTAIITLENLRYVTGTMGNRKNVRVQPENPIHVELISAHGYSMLGEMIDISLDGLSIYLKKGHIPYDAVLEMDSRVEIRLGLPAGGSAAGEDDIHDMRVQARVTYGKESQQTYRIGLLTFLDEPDLGILRRYIFDRQTEILKEIRQMNSALLETV